MERVNGENWDTMEKIDKLLAKSEREKTLPQVH